MPRHSLPAPDTIARLVSSRLGGSAATVALAARRWSLLCGLVVLPRCWAAGRDMMTNSMSAVRHPALRFIHTAITTRSRNPGSALGASTLGGDTWPPPGIQRTSPTSGLPRQPLQQRAGLRQQAVGATSVASRHASSHSAGADTLLLPSIYPVRRVPLTSRAAKQRISRTHHVQSNLRRRSQATARHRSLRGTLALRRVAQIQATAHAEHSSRAIPTPQERPRSVGSLRMWTCMSAARSVKNGRKDHVLRDRDMQLVVLCFSRVLRRCYSLRSG
ncbi:hypothetical protein BDW02DRAFT_178673 [Decorospora gaudefroyi]|uniref:Uncharacterized protein n=1 Tax=Decorospora gaudefroyi TaxID=184978 RepID=A0A6A5JY07_9PLEO|nr:hypothetical protein BDW02DRAFT_178673 [Decorospora gaudefroyi]